jgi:glyoxylase-like metal-dependent hydrolase (beta-lactamase superfamily II)
LTRSNPGIHSIQVGDTTVTALNDGQFEAQSAWIVGPGAEEAEAMLRNVFRPIPPRITVSGFLLETPERRVLVDTGCGGLFGPSMGHVGEKLVALGVAPGSIDMVLLTHAHVDHVGGLLDAQGKPVFDRAELVINGIEADFWSSDDNSARAPEHFRDAFDTARRPLAAYGTRLRRIAGGETVLPGVTARLLAGHTPGHTGYHIASGADALLIWGDIVHLPGIQFARPDAGMAFDSDVSQARATRARVFDETATDRVLVAGIHLDFPVFGHVQRRGAGYGFEPLVWSPTAAGLISS